MSFSLNTLNKLSAVYRCVPRLSCLLVASICMIFSPFALALGLGNIDVQSSLGEPLRATIKIEGATQAIDSSCFRLMRSSDQYAPIALSASMAIRQDGLGNTQLLLKSRQALHDPIVQLTLVADCENQISREYVLLLDPPTADSTKIDASAFDSQLSLITNDSNSIQVKPVADDAPANEPQPQTISLPAAKPARNVKANTAQESRQVSSSKSPTSLESSEQPRLVLSAGEYIRPDFFDGPLQLQMSVELKDWPQDNTQALSADEVSDEVTAMANRLAYLETQMTALQLRNQELESSRARTLIQQNNTDTDWATKLVYSFVTLVVIGFIGIAEWLRRRNSQRQLDAEVAIWEVMTPPDELEGAESDSLMAETESERVSPSAKPSGSKTGALPQQATQAPFHTFDDDAGATVNEDILEQAEVFVAHGRANLAIVLLQDYLSEFPSSSPEPWLLLLDLLQRDNQAEAFAEAAAECKRYFNVAAGDFHQPFEQDHSSVEDYPQVKQQLEQLWGTSAVIPFLDDLIYNRRLNDVVFNRKIEARTGFKRNAYTEILFLRELASEMHLTDKPDHGTTTFSAAMSDGLEEDTEPFEETVVLSAPVLAESTADINEPEPAESIWADPVNETLVESAEPAATEAEAPEAPYLELFEPGHSENRLPEDKSKPLDFEIEFRTDKK